MEDNVAIRIGEIVGEQGGALIALLGAVLDAICEQPGIDANMLRADVIRRLAAPGAAAWDSQLVQLFAAHLRGPSAPLR
ncbi:hypothetical protein D3C81_315340 [compost metagenome]